MGVPRFNGGGAAGPVFARTVLLIVLASVATTISRAQNVEGFVEWTATEGDRAQQTAGDPERRTTFDSFRQRYFLTYDTRLYSNVRFLIGGQFDRTDLSQETDFILTDTRFTRFRPFADISITTPTFVAQFNFTRNEEGIEQSGFETPRTIRDVFSTTFAWTPEETLPRARLLYFRTEARDESRSLLDATEDLAQLYSEYSWKSRLSFRYRGTYQKRKDAVQDNEVQTQSQFGRVTWSDQFWRGRFRIIADYNITWAETDTLSQGSGEVEFPVFALEGLASLDDTPSDDPLAPNPALVDGDRAASAGINLGLPPPGGDTRFRNMGVDLSEPTSVNTLRVWVDREIDPGIAASFVWQVYTSPDNDRWTLRQVVAPAEYGPFETRFDVRFPDALARYVKVAVRPLSPSVPFASNWPEIFVTELEGILIRPSEDVEGTIERTTHQYNMSARTLITRTPNLFYELNYFLRDSTRAPTTWTLSNGFSLTHALNEVYTVSARISRENGEQRGQALVSDRFTASLGVVPAERLRYNLVLSRIDETIGGFGDERTSLYLYTLAELYRGVDLTVGVGQIYIRASDGRAADTLEINSLATLVPHRWVTFNLIYQNRTNERAISGLPIPDDFNRAREISLAFNPLPTIYLFGSYRVESRPDITRRNVWRYEASWTPFPYGNLRLFLRYNELYRSDIDQLERIFIPNVRWNITSRWFVELAYQRQETESPLRKFNNDILSALTRYTF